MILRRQPSAVCTLFPEVERRFVAQAVRGEERPVAETAEAEDFLAEERFTAFLAVVLRTVLRFLVLVLFVAFFLEATLFAAGLFAVFLLAVARFLGAARRSVFALATFFFATLFLLFFFAAILLSS